MSSIHKPTACRAICRESLVLTPCAVCPSPHWSIISGDKTMIPPGLQHSWHHEQHWWDSHPGPGIIWTWVYLCQPQGTPFKCSDCMLCNYNIFDVVARWPGFTHSPIGECFMPGRQGWRQLLSDSGYPLKCWLITQIIAHRTEYKWQCNITPPLGLLLHRNSN